MFPPWERWDHDGAASLPGKTEEHVRTGPFKENLLSFKNNFFLKKTIMIMIIIIIIFIINNNNNNNNNIDISEI